MRLALVFSCQPLHTSHFALLLPSKNAKSKKKNNTATTTECATRATTTSMLVFFLQNGTPMRSRTYKDYCSGKDTPYHALFRRHRLLVCQRKKTTTTRFAVRQTPQRMSVKGRQEKFILVEA